MAAVFSRSANVPYRATIACGVIALAALITAPMIYVRTPYAGDVGDPVTQPIAFDHRHHVRDDGIDCVYCHESVETDAFAGIPSTERCMGCHGQIWPASPQLKLVRASWESGEPIRWQRVTSLPGYVYFHHGVHVHAGIACARCHGRVEDMPRVQRTQSMTMKFCLDCHRERSGGRAISRLTTCSACHR
jgi:hypothetical protein